MRPRWRWILGIGAALALAAAALAAIGYRNARSDPLVREVRLEVAGWPAPRAFTVALLGDVHLGNAAMDAARLTRIVAQVNARHPDLVLIAGDFVAGHDPDAAIAYAAAIVAPLAGCMRRSAWSRCRATTITGPRRPPSRGRSAAPA